MATKEQEITQIGHSVTIKGDISGNSDVRVAGTISGSISTAAAKGVKSDGAMNISGGTINLTVSGGGAIDYTLDSSGNPTTTFSSTFV